jgi:hypothetical protein
MKKSKKLSVPDWLNWTETKRFTITKSGYKFDKYLFRGFLIITAVLLGILVYQFGFRQEIMIECPYDKPLCKNPCYMQVEEVCLPIMHLENVPAGFKYGNDRPESWLLSNFVNVFFFGLASLLVYNHFVNNEIKLRGEKDD